MIALSLFEGSSYVVLHTESQVGMYLAELVCGFCISYVI